MEMVCRDLKPVDLLVESEGQGTLYWSATLELIFDGDSFRKFWRIKSPDGKVLDEFLEGTKETLVLKAFWRKYL